MGNFSNKNVNVRYLKLNCLEVNRLYYYYHDYHFCFPFVNHSCLGSTINVSVAYYCYLLSGRGNKCLVSEGCYLLQPPSPLSRFQLGKHVTLITDECTMRVLEMLFTREIFITLTLRIRIQFYGLNWTYSNSVYYFIKTMTLETDPGEGDDELFLVSISVYLLYCTCDCEEGNVK